MVNKTTKKMLRKRNLEMPTLYEENDFETALSKLKIVIIETLKGKKFEILTVPFGRLGEARGRNLPHLTNPLFSTTYKK